MLMGDFELLDLDFPDKKVHDDTPITYGYNIKCAGFHDKFNIREVHIVYQPNLTTVSFFTNFGINLGFISESF